MSCYLNSFPTDQGPAWGQQRSDHCILGAFRYVTDEHCHRGATTWISGDVWGRPSRPAHVRNSGSHSWVSHRRHWRRGYDAEHLRVLWHSVHHPRRWPWRERHFVDKNSRYDFAVNIICCPEKNIQNLERFDCYFMSQITLVFLGSKIVKKCSFTDANIVGLPFKALGPFKIFSFW